ncbi:MAG: hypothetical protein WBV39_06135 [Rudaea sp.]
MKKLTLGLIFIVVFAASQFAAAPPAQAATCGGLNQHACKKFPNPLKPYCQQWLRNVHGICRPCGGLNQQACMVASKGTVCKQWLRRVKGVCRPCGGRRQQACMIGAKGSVCKPRFIRSHGICVTRADAGKIARIMDDAKRRVRRLKPLIGNMAALLRKIGKRPISNIKLLVKKGKPEDIARILLGEPQINTTFALMRKFGFNTTTLGVESSASLVGGYARETGGSIDINKRARTRLYAANSFLAGVVANVGNDLVISAYTKENDRIGGPLFGALGSFDVGSGVGITLWYDTETLIVQGLSVNIGIGNIGAGGAVVYVDTKVY